MSMFCSVLSPINHLATLSLDVQEKFVSSSEVSVQLWRGQNIFPAF